MLPLLLLALPATSDPAWTKVDAALPPPRLEVSDTRMSAPLLVRDGALVRGRGSKGVELAPLPGTEIGRVLELARDPASLVFVAAEEDLFVVGERIDVLDRVERSGDAPSGRPRSVLVDAQRRVWLATDEAIGVIEPSFGWGRTLEAPAPGPYRLAADGAGSLLVETSAGVYRYRPDSGAAPAVEGLTIGGREVDFGERVELDGNHVEVAARGGATGGAHFRCRVDSHHVWRPLPHSLRLRSPGNHVLEVVAVDRDLNVSEPFRVRLQVPYPAQYEAGFVVPALLGASAILFAGFLWSARRRGIRPAPVRALLSTGLGLVIGLQLLAGFVPHAKGWPFVGYSMYSSRYEEGDVVYRSTLYGLRRDGSAWAIPPGALGAAIDDRWQILRPIINGGRTATLEAIETYNRRWPQTPIEGLQVRAIRLRLTREGPIEVAPLILSHGYAEEEG